MSGETNGLIVPDEIIMNKIYYIRGQKVMLDSDLAELYGVETRRLNEQVARNADRFPEDFMFRLNENEFESLMSQFATSKRGGRRKLPYMFSEHGVLMLSSILNSKQAIQVNIQVMRIFTLIRQMFVDNTEIRLEIEKIKNKLDNQDKNMEIVFRYLDELLEKQEYPNPPRKRIGFKPDDL
ncbi:MAG: ORF6N domain-containing protein [Chitinophagaceae bacterium]|nr:MAG: ORF6N domain-containing protein [Chitinophagaceae bacterium]